MKFRPVCKDNYQTRLQHFLMHDLDKFMSALNDVQNTEVTTANTKDTEKAITTPQVDLKDMPVIYF